VVVDGETGGSQQPAHFLLDEPFETLTRFEVADDAASGAYRMVMVVRERFGEFVPVAPCHTRHPADHTSIDELGEISVRSALRYSRPFDHFLGREWAITVFERCEHCASMCCESLFANRQHLQHCCGRRRSQRRRLRSTRAHGTRLVGILIKWE
jgi:hypothetical protein